MSDRSMDHLCPAAKDKLSGFLRSAAASGLDILVTCTFRSFTEQDALYAQGRTTRGVIVTNAKGGDSWHNYGCAIDVVPLRNGKPQWSVFLSAGIMEPEWKTLGTLAEAHGIEWAGTWQKFKEFAHFQYTGGLTLADLKAGKLPN